MKINAINLDYKTLNQKIHTAVHHFHQKQISLLNVNGQRFIASGIDQVVNIKIHGVPGNDLGSFMNGPVITLDGNAQDAVGNTMSGGKIIINGHAGDAIGYSMRGGKIFIRGNVGYRTGIHMKQYKDNIPIIVIGGRAKDFLGEYMAGGIIVVYSLPISQKASACGHYLGTGMHGGAIYLPESKKPRFISSGLKIDRPNNTEKELLNHLSTEFLSKFGGTLTSDDKKTIKNTRFIKIHPASHRPYGNLYAY